MRHRIAVLALVLAIGLMIPASTAASAQSGFGGTLVIEEDETVESVSGIWGSVVIHGTVTGDVSASAGNIAIPGTVQGDVSVGTGRLEISGTVGGDVNAGAGSITLADGSVVGGDVSAGGGTVELLGTVEGSATVGGDTIQLGDNAAIAGDLQYDGTLEGNRDAVAGSVTRDRSTGVELGPSIQPFGSVIFSVYVLLLNLIVGALLLGLLPTFSARVADRVGSQPLKTGAAGLGALLVTPALLVGIAITIIGIPLAIVGALLFAVILWIAIIYGRFAVAAWLLGRVDIESRWIALVAGLAGGALLVQVPYAGDLFNLLLLLLGLGAVSIGLVASLRGRRAEG